MDVLTLAAALFVAGAIMAGMAAAYASAAGPRGEMDRRLGHMLSNEPVTATAGASYETRRSRRTGRFPIFGKLLEGKAWTDEVAARLERADLRLTVSEFVAVRFILGVFLATMGVFLVAGTVGLVLAMFLMLVGFRLPNMYVNFAIGRRLKKLTNQLPDTLSLLANSLKAGFGVMQSMDLAARELPHPIATELRRTLHDINMGSATDVALQGLASRNGSDDLDIVVTAMLIQQSTGGNLAEILENVNHTMRERIRIRGEIKTLTSQQMLTGLVIGGLPIGLALVFQVMNPEYMRPLFEQPLGNAMIAGAVALELFGIFLIRKILDIEV